MNVWFVLRFRLVQDDWLEAHRLVDEFIASAIW